MQYRLYRQYKYESMNYDHIKYKMRDEEKFMNVQEKILHASPTSMTMKEAKHPILLFRQMANGWLFNLREQLIRQGWDMGYYFTGFEK